MGNPWEIHGKTIITGWWFGTFGLFFHILETIIPLTNSMIFQRGRYTTNQINNVVKP